MCTHYEKFVGHLDQDLAQILSVRDLLWRAQLFYTQYVYLGEPTTVFAKEYELEPRVCENTNYLQISSALS